MHRLSFVASAALLSVSSAAYADTIQNFIASGVFADGSTLSGQLVIDTTIGAVASVNLTDSIAYTPIDYNFVSIASQSATRFPTEYSVGARNAAGTEDFNFTIPDKSAANPLVGYGGGSICSLSVACGAGSNLFNLVTNAGGAQLVAGTLTPIPNKTLGADIYVKDQTAGNTAVAKVEGLFPKSLGTLNSIGINLSGTAHDLSSKLLDLITTPLNDTPPGNRIVPVFLPDPFGRPQSGTFTYTFSRPDTNTSTFGSFETSQTDNASYQYLDLQFDFLAETSLDRTFGTITYNYAPFPPSVGSSGPTAVPEPTSVALLGFGLLGALGVARKRFARTFRPLTT